MIGHVLILNGTSSAGKTTLAKELQVNLDGVYLHCSIDAFWHMTPPTIGAGSHNFPHMKLAFAKSVKALAVTGHNVIVDIVFNGKKSYDELSSALSGIEHVVVKVDCAIEELERREISRGDRDVGLARSQIETVHLNVPYDFIIDTTKLSVDRAANYLADNVSFVKKRAQ